MVCLTARHPNLLGIWWTWKSVLQTIGLCQEWFYWNTISCGEKFIAHIQCSRFHNWKIRCTGRNFWITLWKSTFIIKVRNIKNISHFPVHWSLSARNWNETRLSNLGEVNWWSYSKDCKCTSYIRFNYFYFKLVATKSTFQFIENCRWKGLKNR